MICRQWDEAPSRPRTLEADQATTTRRSWISVRDMHATPHVTQNTARPGGSAIDARTSRHEGTRRANMRVLASNPSSPGAVLAK